MVENNFGSNDVLRPGSQRDFREQIGNDRKCHIFSSRRFVVVSMVKHCFLRPTFCYDFFSKYQYPLTWRDFFQRKFLIKRRTDWPNSKSFIECIIYYFFFLRLYSTSTRVAMSAVFTYLVRPLYLTQPLYIPLFEYVIIINWLYYSLFLFFMF